MKSLKFLALAAIAAAFAQQASAQTTVYITGSTAFRTAAIAAINTVTGLSAPSGSDASYSATFYPKGQTATSTRNTTFIWSGGSVSGNPVTVKAAFTGSASGVGTTLGNLAIPFLPDGVTGATNPSAYIDVQGSLPNINTQTFTAQDNSTQHGIYDPSVQQVPNIAFSDAFQASTPFAAGVTKTLLAPFNTTVTFPAAAHDASVGFVTFKIVASTGFPLGTGGTGVSEAPFTGSYTVSSYSAEPNTLGALFSTGSVPLSRFTGSTLDLHKLVYATGRNPDSGTRIGFLADTGFGINNTVVQYQPTVGATPVTTITRYPIEIVAGSSTSSNGNSGEATGGTLRAYMGDTIATGASLSIVNGARTAAQSSTVTAAYFLTYLGTGDASSVAGTAVELSYKGVPFSLQAIYNGQYTYWAQEHIFDNGTTGVVDTFRTTLISTLQGTATPLSNAGISQGDLYNSSTNPTGPFLFTRSADGGRISTLYTP